ncbi:MAG: hypothetical protein P8018_01330 [Acidobacteriota bacterium]
MRTLLKFLPLALLLVFAVACGRKGDPYPRSQAHGAVNVQNPVNQGHQKGG